MPLINVKTSLKEIGEEANFLKSLSSQMAGLTGKPEKYVMVSLEKAIPMLMGGEEEDSCYIEVKSIGSIKPSEMSKHLCKLINAYLGVKEDKIYINFEDIKASNWGYNGRTFG